MQVLTKCNAAFSICFISPYSILSITVQLKGIVQENISHIILKQAHQKYVVIYLSRQNV